jgi:hypothetical protein
VGRSRRTGTVRTLALPAHRDRCFGKPLHAISRFRHQNAQTPPSPLVGEGGCSQGEMFWHAPACHLPFQASERPDSPFSPCGRRGLLTGGDVLASPCVPSPVSGIRTPRLPLLPLWEKGVGGMRGNGARECRTSLISPKHSTLESAPPGCAGIPPACSSTKVRTAWVRGRPARTQQHKGTHRLGARASRPHTAL